MSYVGPEQWNAENAEAFDAVADERLESFGRGELSRSLAAGDTCMCVAYDADSDETEIGWRPCPPNLCERDGHEHPQGEK